MTKKGETVISGLQYTACVCPCHYFASFPIAEVMFYYLLSIIYKNYFVLTTINM